LSFSQETPECQVKTEKMAKMGNREVVEKKENLDVTERMEAPGRMGRTGIKVPKDHLDLRE
jgi:hypothetical protein